MSPNTYENLRVEPNSATFELTAKNQDKPVQLNSRTYVDKHFVLHTQKTLPSGTQITITGIATYINPSGATEKYTNELVITIA